MTNPPPVAPVVTDEMVQAVEAYLAALPASSTAELRAMIARQDKQLNEATDTFFAQKALASARAFCMSGLMSGLSGLRLIRNQAPSIPEWGYKSFILFREYPWIRNKMKRCGAMLTSCDFINM